jgi:PAS domain S-box-containing protein
LPPQEIILREGHKESQVAAEGLHWDRFCMLDDIVNNPALDRYLLPFKEEQVIFHEGDNSQDLYILASGQLDILKGNTKITQITEPGSLFGEMSFLLEASRTATVRAGSEGKAIRIPKEKINNFLRDFPTVAREISKLLAQRLEQTSQIVYGLKEFCDQLPDAVIFTDREGKILTWNSAAEGLYGRNWQQMQDRSVEEIYEDPRAYRKFIKEVQSKDTVRERILRIKHPEQGTRFISTSTTVLHDDHHNFLGVLSLGRDVTAAQSLEKRYRRIWYWLIPVLCAGALLSAALFFGIPRIQRSHPIQDTAKSELRNQIAKDYFLLRSLLIDDFQQGNEKRITHIMRNFFDAQEAASAPYTGTILLDPRKHVLYAYSIRTDADMGELIGSTYSGIEFEGDDESLHRVLTLYRADQGHPMSHKGIEVAFVIEKDNELLGWLIFQMDVDRLASTYGVDEGVLKQFEFKRRQ